MKAYEGYNFNVWLLLPSYSLFLLLFWFNRTGLTDQYHFIKSGYLIQDTYCFLDFSMTTVRIKAVLMF